MHDDQVHVSEILMLHVYMGILSNAFLGLMIYFTKRSERTWTHAPHKILKISRPRLHTEATLSIKRAVLCP